jgi:hypothetical protein
MAVQISVTKYLKAVKRTVLILTTKVLTFIFPETKWYKSAIIVSNFFGLFYKVRSRKKSKGFSKAQDVNSFLSLMTRRQKKISNTI